MRIIRILKNNIYVHNDKLRLLGRNHLGWNHFHPKSMPAFGTNFCFHAKIFDTEILCKKKREKKKKNAKCQWLNKTCGCKEYLTLYIDISICYVERQLKEKNRQSGGKETRDRTKYGYISDRKKSTYTHIYIKYTSKNPHSLQAWCNFSSSESVESVESNLCMSMIGTFIEEAFVTIGGSWSGRTYLEGTLVWGCFANSWTQATWIDLPRFVCFCSIAPREYAKEQRSLLLLIYLPLFLPRAVSH